MLYKNQNYILGISKIYITNIIYKEPFNSISIYINIKYKKKWYKTIKCLIIQIFKNI